MRIALGCLALAACMGTAFAQDTVIHGKDGIALPAAPKTEKRPVTDTYKVAGATDAKVTDDYRWLEDAKSPATRAYIGAQNAYTQQYLDQVKILPEVRTQMAALLKVDQMSTPTERNGKYFFSRRLADENQASIYMRVGLHGEDVKLIDGNSRSSDGNTSVNLNGITEDGSLLLYGVRVGGADESEVHFFDVASRKDTADVLPSARYYGVQVAPDKKGVYYSRFYPHVGNKVFYHAFGTTTDNDTMLLGGEYRGEKLGEIDGIGVRITANGHYLVMSINRGVPAEREDILLKDLRVKDSPIESLVYGIDSRFSEMNVGDDFYVDTDFNAPNHRVLKAVMGQKPEEWKTVIPEAKDVLEGVNIVGGKMFVLRLHDVKSELTAYTLEGKETGKIALPGIGAGSELSGRVEDKDGFYTFQSIVTPPTIFHYDVVTGKSEVFDTQKVPFNSSAYELKEVFYTSKDGTRVPMFIAGKKGLKRDGSERLLMTGYGGFALSETPVWNPEYAWWMEQGGYFALPDLRGGNEYGEAWHKAAMFEKKQNVFDDWYAAAEYLVANKYTSAAHFAIRGRSNGGLLMGASMTQRPDLFGAIWCGYPLLDMLRYQNFLMGRTWTTEYGSAEDPAQFAYIRAYSPYQNVKMGAKYPAILFFTGDGDTRVDPMNARKMTPLMQEASGSGRPVLLHYSLKGGHSAGVSQTQLVEDYADEMGFLWTETK
ncbi:prolyl oligopeptidase family serine peptidase [Granulicella tundricola]|uniref:prolyl oligopeptidase n=1 Tax=Granulicella tundricola (strain ATCC BAA-1859 / DSM 23138 / MP5ACTX9) TaxID=1198114 RepID=E8WWS1_GRATM|nr:prolyl oligopeptidase family serine peptidase [Granulicella tundricola]ADW67399.1 Prolyl oligopeptidase [Granulicella tundricola MP5ACTX9]